MRLSKQRPDNKFYNKKSVLSYMAKALLYEMRQANLVNNESFNFRTSDGDDLRLKEQYLQQIELSPNTSLLFNIGASSFMGRNKNNIT